MNNNLFLVKFKMCEQISPDEYEVRFKERLFPDDTTIAEIKEWVKCKFNGPNSIQKFQLFEVSLSEPESTAK